MTALNTTTIGTLLGERVARTFAIGAIQPKPDLHVTELTASKLEATQLPPRLRVNLAIRNRDRTNASGSHTRLS